MGRKTLESLGKPLKNRTNVVISRNTDLKIEGAHVFNDLEEALNWSKNHETEEIYIIGGSSVYEQSMNLADRIYLTRVHKEFEGDSYFPEINNDWKLISSERQTADEKNPYDYTFEVYEKVN
jgi:dihydrofolate reductase